MTNLSDSAINKLYSEWAFELGYSYNIDPLLYLRINEAARKGFSAGYEVGIEENDRSNSAIFTVNYVTLLELQSANEKISNLQSQVQLLEDALIKVGAYFDCLSCESQHGYVCEHHLDDRMQAARD